LASENLEGFFGLDCSSELIVGFVSALADAAMFLVVVAGV